MRIGLGAVRGLGDDLAGRIVAERDAHGAYASPEDLVRRVPGLSIAHLEALATAGAFGCFGLDRRRALWVAGAVAQTGADRLDGIVTGVDAPTLPGLDPLDEARADLWATGVSPEGHPTRFVRDVLDRLGVVPAADLVDREHGSRVTVGGVVTHRQRPATAGRHHVRQPRGRERPAQHRGVQGLLGPPPPGGAHRGGAAGAGPARAGRGRHQRDRRAHRGAADPGRTSAAATSADPPSPASAHPSRADSGSDRPLTASMAAWRRHPIPRAALGAPTDPASTTSSTAAACPSSCSTAPTRRSRNPRATSNRSSARRPGHRRIYVDLPGMGASSADGIDGPGDALDAIAAVVDDRIGDEPFLVVAQSYGGYLARGLVDRRPAQVAGLALICPLLISGAFAGEHAAVHVAGDIDGMLTPEQDAEYRGYFVVQTPETARPRSSRPSPRCCGRFDGPAVERIMEGRLDRRSRRGRPSPLRR